MAQDRRVSPTVFRVSPTLSQDSLDQAVAEHLEGDCFGASRGVLERFVVHEAKGCEGGWDFRPGSRSLFIGSIPLPESDLLVYRLLQVIGQTNRTDPNDSTQ